MSVYFSFELGDEKDPMAAGVEGFNPDDEADEVLDIVMPEGILLEKYQVYGGIRSQLAGLFDSSDAAMMSVVDENELEQWGRTDTAEFNVAESYDDLRLAVWESLYRAFTKDPATERIFRDVQGDMAVLESLVPLLSFEGLPKERRIEALRDLVDRRALNDSAVWVALIWLGIDSSDL